MLIAALTQAAPAEDPFQGYPPWLVILIGTLVAVLLLWIFGKLLKWTIWVLIALVLVGGLITAGRLLLE
ncbi:MAG: hypothetical protein Q7S40_28665 [Opitutaceae bacterium]|nr:hypothetical protein [Opitutaceae bacterium]